MLGPEDLRSALKKLDGQGYPAYKALLGSYDFGEFRLHIDRVQGDPFAPPSRCRLVVPHGVSRYPRPLLADATRRVAVCDLVARRVRDVIGGAVRGRRGAGRSGLIHIDAGGQQILERSAVRATEEGFDVRLEVGLPAYGRRIVAREAEEMFFLELPRIVRHAVLFDPESSDHLSEHVEAAVNQAALAAQLEDRGLVAFIADGSVLPRESGTSQLPMDPDRVVLFESCDEFRVSLELPSGDSITGMGIPEGVTLIVGGGYHGKSTLLDAIQTGIYTHIPGDGRECVVTIRDTAKIRAEYGRRVAGVDISPYIRSLPDGTATSAFSTACASGSTSQAANIQEALETGVRLLLIDEDTSATNFMVQDARMQRLVAEESEPIVPFVDAVQSLHRDRGVSTILVMGGCGDYLDVADTVILMEGYLPKDARSRAREVVRELPSLRTRRAVSLPPAPRPRVPDPASIDASRGSHERRIGTHGMDYILFGEHEISFRQIEMLVDPSQLRAIGEAIEYAKRSGVLDGRHSLAEIAQWVEDRLMAEGVECVSPDVGRHPGRLASFRRHDLAAAINRLPTLALVAEPGQVPRPPAGEPGGEAPGPAPAPASSKRRRRRGLRRR